MLTYDVISSIKRVFSKSKFAKQLKMSKLLRGVTGPRGGKMVECEVCGKPTPFYKCQVDHRDPITPVMLSQKVMSFIMLYERTFCDASNLQVICDTCHKAKNKIEASERAKWRRKKKYLVVRHKHGSRMRVMPIINLKELNDYWEVLAVFTKRKDADADCRRRKKL